MKFNKIFIICKKYFYYIWYYITLLHFLEANFKLYFSQGAFWGLMVGLLAGGSRFIWEFSYSVPSCASGLPDPRPYIISKVHYLHFGILLFLLTGIVAIIVSLLTQPIDKIHVSMHDRYWY